METNRLGFSIVNMDPSADPAQDFYRFAAGGWLDRATIPSTESQVNGFIGLYRRVNEQILALLRSAADASHAAPKGCVEQQVGHFYASAMDTERLDALGMAPIEPELERSDGISAPADLAAALAHLFAVTGSPAILVPVVLADKKQSHLNVLHFYPGDLSLGNRDIYLDDAHAPIRAAFLRHVAAMLRLAGVADAAADEHYLRWRWSSSPGGHISQERKST